MPTITDWIMVGITFLYMLFTIGIFIANLRSSESAKSQLEETKKQMDESKNQFKKQLSEMRAQLNESKNQFNESQRLSCQPFLQVEIPNVIPKAQFEINLPLCKDEEVYDHLYNNVFIKNIGKGAATNIIYSWEIKDINVYNSNFPQINGIMQGDKYCMQITSCYRENPQDIQGLLLWEFNDMLGNRYKQKLTIYFEDNELIRCENDTPELIG